MMMITCKQAQLHERNKMNTFDIVNMREADTGWLCNSRAFERAMPNAKHAYVVVERDSEYGFPIHRGVFFTADEAREFAISIADEFTCAKSLEHFVLGEDSVELLYKNNRDLWVDTSTNISILWYADDGEHQQKEKTYLFATRNYYSEESK